MRALMKVSFVALLAVVLLQGITAARAQNPPPVVQGEKVNLSKLTGLYVLRDEVRKTTCYVAELDHGFSGAVAITCLKD
jgi:hypothetical protein